MGRHPGDKRVEIEFEKFKVIFTTMETISKSTFPVLKIEESKMKALCSRNNLRTNTGNSMNPITPASSKNGILRRTRPQLGTAHIFTETL